MNISLVHHARTLLFVPGDRPERFGKAAASDADSVVLDLEDAVGASRRSQARIDVVAHLESGHDAVVRINAAGTADFEDDVAALSTRKCVIMLAKADARSIAELADALPTHPVIALIETARGILDAEPVAMSDRVERLALGTIDLAAELGVDPDSSPLIDRAREDLAYTSAAAGLPRPIDGVTPSIDDADRLAHDAERAVTFGFAGKLCIHPRQVSAIHTALSPTDTDIFWARSILAAADAPGAAAVFTVDGTMVDKPVVDRARSIIARSH